MTSNPSFFTRPPTSWDIIDYLNTHDPASPDYNHQIALDKWTKALTDIASDASSPRENRERAALLLNRYKTQRQLEVPDDVWHISSPLIVNGMLTHVQTGRSSDRNRAREWLCLKNPSKKRKLRSGASVTIFQAPVNQGTFNNATFNQGGSRKRAVESVQVGDNVAGMVYQAPMNQGVFNDTTFNQVTVDSQVSEPDVACSSAVPHKPASEPHPEFTKAYNAMCASSKFTFTSTSRVLEDIIYESALSLSSPHSAHLWVVDLGDPIITSWFDDEELAELQSLTLPFPEVDKPFVDSMRRFSSATTAEDFRRIAETIPYRAEGERYDRSKHFDAAWVNTAILSMLAILESPNNLLLYPSLREGWFDCNPWSFLIDQCLLGLDGILVQRKEILCLALKLATPSPPRRFDAIIHTLGTSPLEFGAIEVSKSPESTDPGKYTIDILKLTSALRAMLGRLCAVVEGDEETVRRLQVVGMVNAGVGVQVVRMCMVGGGGVAVLERGKVRMVPVEVGGLKGVFRVLGCVQMFKAMIRECVDVVKAYSGREDGRAEEDFEEMVGRREL